MTGRVEPKPLKIVPDWGEDVFFTLYDAQGRNVWSQTAFNALGQIQMVADFQGVADGIYQLQLVAGDSRNTVQLIKQ